MGGGMDCGMFEGKKFPANQKWPSPPCGDVASECKNCHSDPSHWCWFLRIPNTFRITLVDEVRSDFSGICPTCSPLRQQWLSPFGFQMSDFAGFCFMHNHQCVYCWWTLKLHLGAAVKVGSHSECALCDLQQGGFLRGSDSGNAH